MKGITDRALTVCVKNTLVNYDVKTDTLTHRALSVTKYCKNGFLAFDERSRNIGIVFASDDKRTVRYGSAELLFFKKYENEFGTWRNIKQNGQYISFASLENYLSQHPSYTLTTDARFR